MLADEHENTRQLLVDITMTGLPGYMVVQARRRARTCEGEFTVPLVFAEENKAFFTDVAFVKNGRSCSYLGMQMRCVTGYRHGVFGGVDTQALHHRIEKTYFPPKRADYSDVISEAIRNELKDTIAYQLERLAKANPEMYLRMVTGFGSVGLPRIAPIDQQVDFYGKFLDRICWFDGVHGITYAQARNLVDQRDIPHGLFVDAGADNLRKAGWYQVDYDSSTAGGIVQLRQMPPDQLDVAADLSRIQYLGDQLPHQPTVTAWLKQGHGVEIFPYADQPDYAVTLVADPIAGRVGFYDQSGRPLDSKIFTQATAQQQNNSIVHKEPQLSEKQHRKLFRPTAGRFSWPSQPYNRRNKH